MTTRGPHVSLVVPVHHCEGSLDALLGELDRFLAKAPTATELLLVDDRGSAPNASAELCRFANRPHVRVLQNDRNRGKGYSVARGMLEATGLFRVFTDADLAYPLDEVWKIVSVLESGAVCAVLMVSQALEYAGTQLLSANRRYIDMKRALVGWVTSARPERHPGR